MNSELNINTRNNENQLIDRIINNYSIEIILGTRKAFIYKDGSLIKDIKLSNIAQRVYNKDHHFYIVTKKFNLLGKYF